jgi:hypothetical protein
MIEYGHAVADGAGKASGSHGGGGGGGGDWGANLSQMATDAVHHVSTMPPGQLLLLVGAVVVGLMVLRKAL